MEVVKLKVLAEVIAQGFGSYRNIGEYKGCSVFMPIYADGKVRFTGIPLFILAKGDKIRWSISQEESFEILRHLF